MRPVESAVLRQLPSAQLSLVPQQAFTYATAWQLYPAHLPAKQVPIRQAAANIYVLQGRHPLEALSKSLYYRRVCKDSK